MDNVLTNNDNTVIYYAVKVNGNIVGPSYGDRIVAENAKVAMMVECAAELPIMEVVPVTADGKELLFG